jgi:hypothetical protein
VTLHTKAGRTRDIQSPAIVGAFRDEVLKDELKKLGLRIRPRVVEPRPPQPGPPGQIAFDDRGNAVYEWQDGRLKEDGEAGERARDQALALPGLAIVDDETPANAPIRSNPKGLRIGYNPYQSGLLAKRGQAQAPRKRRDLRELSKWMEAKRNAKPDGQEE